MLTSSIHHLGWNTQGEALFGQSVALYYSMWYKKNEIGSRLAMFIGAGVTAGGFGGLIAYAVSMLGHNSWRILWVWSW